MSRGGGEEKRPKSVKYYLNGPYRLLHKILITLGLKILIFFRLNVVYEEDIIKGLFKLL